MPINSFLIKDILDTSGSKSDLKHKKRTLSQYQSKSVTKSPSLSPSSLVSSTSTSSLSDDTIPQSELDPSKYHCLKNSYPTIFFNQFLNPMQNLLKSDDSLVLFSNYYNQLLNGHKKMENFENDFKIKRIRLDSDTVYSGENENVSPLDALLNLANNINKSGLVQPEIKQDKADFFESRRLNSSSSSFDGSETLKSVPKQISTNSLKRKRKNRTAFTANQIFELEKRFSAQKYLSPHDRDRIAYELQLTTAQVITWFQNRRAKQKRDIEELKNDVNAAKTLKVIDTGLDIDKAAIRPCDERSKNESRSSESDYTGADDEELDVDDTENYSNLSQSLISNQNDDDCASISSTNK
ncbi:transcription factor LBX1-like [Brachionus plicatilis]|uniref:Transcription factor LBX1-like n=1 Tax=Brachionus plicatilis TaxID=10195 RepID=A0A3M7RKN2_BRAPC|nr:transcription factor LBX1-like [Brachionus plicatilis]